MIAAVVLAAGASRRYGAAKQLETVDGESWVGRAARLAREAGCSPVRVVTGAHADRVSRELRGMEGVSPVHHPGWRHGMGSSIAAGIRSLDRTSPPHAVLFLTCDQLALDATILKRLVDAFDAEPRRIVACAYAGTVGIPALFGDAWFGQLESLEGDRGAKTLLVEGSAWRVDIDWPPGAADRDRRRGPVG